MRYTSNLLEDIIKIFGKPKVESRFNILYQEMNLFIANNGFSDFLMVNSDLLAMAVLDYFLNINEICQFHSTQYINDQKNVSYTTYWILCRKPIQIYNDSV